MLNEKLDGLRNDSGYKIRCMKSLVDQIKEDHAELNRLCKRLEYGSTDNFDEEELLRLTRWLRDELNLFKELRQKGIEGVCWGEIEEIERDVQNKERTLGLNTDNLTEKPPFPV